MKVAICDLASNNSALSFSRCHEAPKEKKETPDAYDERTWRERLHYNAEGSCVVPAMMLKFCVTEAAKRNPTRIPGRGTSTYTKHIEGGVLVFEDMLLLGVDHKPIPKETVTSIRIHAHANGKRGSGSRVWRRFPMIMQWSGTATFYLSDSTITADVFERALVEAGNGVGLGRFAPRVGGFNGRFRVVDVKWEEAA